MKSRQKYAMAAAAAVIVPAIAVATWALKPLPPPTEDVTRPASPPQRHVILIGESWAGRKQVGEGIVAAAGEKNVPVAVCQIGYSGCWAGKVLKGVKRGDLAAGVERCGFKGIDDAVVFAGINDVSGHRGAEAYASKVTALVDELHRFGIPNVHVMTIGNVDWERAEGTGFTLFQHVLMRSANDDGEVDPSPSYRAALRAAKPRASFIDYDDFAPKYREQDFVDGVHLTDERYFALGRFIGKKLLEK